MGFEPIQKALQPAFLAGSFLNLAQIWHRFNLAMKQNASFQQQPSPGFCPLTPFDSADAGCVHHANRPIPLCICPGFPEREVHWHNTNAAHGIENVVGPHFLQRGKMQKITG